MSDYYRETLEKLHHLMDQGDYSEARSLIQTELNLPYVPREFEQQLLELRRDLPRVTSQTATIYTDIDDILSALDGSSEVQMKAIISLQSLNVRDFVNEIGNYLEESHDDQLKKSVLMVLMAQHVDQVFGLELNGRWVQLNPRTLVNPLEAEAYAAALQLVDDFLGQNEPSLVIMAQQMITERVIQDFPEIPADAVSLFRESLSTLYSALGRVNEWQELEKEITLGDSSNN